MSDYEHYINSALGKTGEKMEDRIVKCTSQLEKESMNNLLDAMKESTKFDAKFTDSDWEKKLSELTKSLK